MYVLCMYTSIVLICIYCVLVEKICAKIWTNCAYNDRSVKFGTQIGGVIRKIFGYRDIADLTFSDL